MNNFAVILVAAGKSRRFVRGTRESFGLSDSLFQKKPFVRIGGRSIWLYSVDRFVARRDVRQILLVVSPENRREIEEKFSMDLAFHSIELVDGGGERFESVENALNRVRDEIDFVAVHDAARPCVSDAAVANVFEKAIQFNAAILAAPVVGTIKKGVSRRRAETSEIERLQNRLRYPSESGFVSDESQENAPIEETSNAFIEATVSRQNLWEAQTPQVFRKELLLRAYRERRDSRPTDDAQLVENLGESVALVPSDRTNLKITTAEDLPLAEALLNARSRSSSRRPFDF